MKPRDIHTRDLPADLFRDGSNAVSESSKNITMAAKKASESASNETVDAYFQCIRDSIWDAIKLGYIAGLGSQADAAADTAAIRRIGQLLRGVR